MHIKEVSFLPTLPPNLMSLHSSALHPISLFYSKFENRNLVRHCEEINSDQRGKAQKPVMSTINRKMSPPIGCLRLLLEIVTLFPQHQEATSKVAISATGILPLAKEITQPPVLIKSLIVPIMSAKKRFFPQRGHTKDCADSKARYQYHIEIAIFKVQ